MNRALPKLLRGSLGSRLLLGTVFWIAASIAVAGWGLGALFRQHVSVQFHAGLTMHLDQLTAQLALAPDGVLRVGPLSGDPRFSRPLSGLYWQVARADEARPPAPHDVLRSRSLWDQALALPADALADGEIHRHRLTGPAGEALRAVERTVTLDGVPVRLVVAADERQLLEPVREFDGHLWLALGMLGAGLCLAAWMQVQVGLAPLRRLRDALGRVQRGDAPQIEGRFPAEVMPLVTDFNAVLVQNAGMVERARTQAGNLAHALKTPLSVLANATRDAGPLADAPHAAEPALARLVAAQVQVIGEQVERHLRRAQTAAAVQRHGARTPVGPVVQGLVRVMQRVHADRALQIAVHPGAEPLAFRGDEPDLQELLGNLLDNACKWARARIDIHLAADAAQLVVHVDDDGPGIAEPERARVLQRGVRADEQVPGTGLGLHICDELARLHEGQLALATSPLGGLRATVRLPRG